MMLKSLAMRSELLTLSGISQLTKHSDFLIQSTPTEPDFWMGNQLILQNNDLSAKEAFEVFEAQFPDATHRSIVWDMPNVDPAILPSFDDFNCALEGFDTMTLWGDLRDADVPEGIELRPLESASDWEKVLALQAEVGVEEGRNPTTHVPYLARRNAGRRAQIEKGLGQWFGAFDGKEIVASMGMFHDDQIARYQSVETKASHRKRGICSALLRHTAIWALERAPKATVVIVAEADTDAGRLYRKMGFAHAETIFGVVRDGY